MEPGWVWFWYNFGEDPVLFFGTSCLDPWPGHQYCSPGSCLDRITRRRLRNVLNALRVNLPGRPWWRRLVAWMPSGFEVN